MAARDERAAAFGSDPLFSAPSIRIGRVFGIPIEVNLSWIVIFLLVSFSLAFVVFPAELRGQATGLYLVLAALTALAFFISIVVHELAHSVVAKAGGLEVGRITLFMLGGVSELSEEPHSPGREFLMAFAGPAASFVLALISFVVYAALYAAGVSKVIWFPFQYLAGVNFLVGVFNLLPGFPLDGGRVLRSMLWGATGDLDKATRWAARIGQLIGWGMVGLAVAGMVIPPLFGGAPMLGLLWFGIIGWFVASLAGQAYHRQIIRSELATEAVYAVMTPHPQTVPGEISVEQLAHDYLLGGRHSRYPVMVDGHIIGLITLPDVKALPREQWPATRVDQITRRDLASLTVDVSEPVDSVVDRLAGEGPGALLVVQHGRLSGIVTRADAMAAMRRADH